MSDIHGVIEEFADGEAVPPDALMAALATVEGREHLIDTLRLRSLVAGRAPAMVVASTPSRRPMRRYAAFAAAAAAVAALCVFGGYRAGQARLAATLDAKAGSTDTGSTAAPAPTTVIKLDAASGWREQVGGS